MIKRLTTAFLLSVALTTSVGAQEPTKPELGEAPEDLIVTQPFFLTIALPCHSKTEMRKVIAEKYGEKPFTEAKGQMTIAGQQAKLPGIVKVWANPQTWSFTITIEDPRPEADVMCMLTSGSDLAPTSEDTGDNL